MAHAVFTKPVPSLVAKGIAHGAEEPEQQNDHGCPDSSAAAAIRAACPPRTALVVVVRPVLPTCIAQHGFSKPPSSSACLTSPRRPRNGSEKCTRVVRPLHRPPQQHGSVQTPGAFQMMCFAGAGGADPARKPLGSTGLRHDVIPFQELLIIAAGQRPLKRSASFRAFCSPHPHQTSRAPSIESLHAWGNVPQPMMPPYFRHSHPCPMLVRLVHNGNPYCACSARHALYGSHWRDRAQTAGTRNLRYRTQMQSADATIPKRRCEITREDEPLP